MSLKTLLGNHAVKIYKIEQKNKLYVVVPTPDYNNEITKKFISSLSNSKIHPSIMIVESSGREFNFSKSMNTGILEALKNNPEYIMISNNDVFPTQENWAEKLINSLTAFKLTAYAVPHLINSRSLLNVDPVIKMPNRFTVKTFTHLYPMLPEKTLPLIARIREYFRSNNISKTSNGSNLYKIKPPYYFLNCQPICLFKAGTLENIGYFDEKFQNGGEDFDLSIRSLLFGFKPVLSKSTIFEDIQSSTLGGGWANALYTPKKNIRASNNWRYLIDKHGNKYNKILKNGNLFYTT